MASHAMGLKQQRWLSVIVALALLFCTFSMLTASASTPKRSYVVYMGSHGHLPVNARRPVVTEEDQRLATDNHHQFLASFLGSPEAAKEAMIHSYNKYINGFAAILDESEAERIAAHPEVLSLFPNKMRKLHTTHSMDFLDLEGQGILTPRGQDVPGTLWRRAKFGEGVIIANLDTGVWPESESFNDHGYGPIPAKWRGICQNDTALPVTCNKKLIGARYFNDGHLAYAKAMNITVTDVATPRDMEGHGSHTLSTAGGNFVAGASVFGIGNGTAKGSAPRARVAAYKVCWSQLGDGGGCSDADILQAFDHAMNDGVDVLSISLGSDPSTFAEDGVAVGSFHAVKHGIAIVASGGNSGPTPGSVSNVAPWMFTIAASTIDRDFETFAELGNGLRLKGASLSSQLKEHKMYPLLSAADAKAANASASDALLCKPGTLDSKKVLGKILVCLRGNNSRAEKGQQAKLAGAVGMILCNDELNGDSTAADPNQLPSVSVTYNDGQLVFKYLNSTKNPVGYITPPKAVIGVKPAPSMATFSSRGPNVIVPTLIKPDITAPGVDIIAAYSQAISPTEEPFDTRRVPFNIMSGTSMSCPHVSGVFALLKAIHPDWSQAALMSSLMTTASLVDNNGKPIEDGFQAAATPFSYGSGHINPSRAMHPGLVYDADITDYLNFLCALGQNSTQMEHFNLAPYKCPESATLDINYPSISAPYLNNSITLTRKLKNVDIPGVYRVRVVPPPGIHVKVHPGILKFSKFGEEKSFKITLSPKKHNNGDTYVFGEMTWSDGIHFVRSPIAANVVSTTK